MHIIHELYQSDIPHRFRPRSSAPVISLEHAEGLYRYIWGFVKEKGAVLYRIGGMEDHREGRGDSVYHALKRTS